MDNRPIRLMQNFKCRGCGWYVTESHIGHGPGCMLREDLRKFYERQSGATPRLPGMRTTCPRCHELRPDGERQHIFCPKRLPE